MFVLKDFLSRITGPAVMGIVNVTGDSFSEGVASAPDSAVERAEKLLAAGADLLDIGGESTRPGAEEITVQDELHRVIPVLETLRSRYPEAVLSVDTRHAAVAAAALESGAAIINDISMLKASPDMASTVAHGGGALIISHSRGVPGNMQQPEFTSYPGGVANGVRKELMAAKSAAQAAGVDAGNILLDPGIGFAKNSDQCWELLRDLRQVAAPEMMAVGISRKSFLGAVSQEAEPARRGGETLAIELELAAAGVAMLRTHNVRMLCNALRVIRHFRSM